MIAIITLLTTFVAQGQLQTRFELATPLSGIPGVMIDSYTNGSGLAIQTARSKGLQGRMMWIDATANIERYNTEEKIVSLVAKIADVGFNTIVFDIKPISGQVVYKSHIAPKLLEWRSKKLPADFDPLPIFVREAHKHGLFLITSLNAFSEGHSMFKVGPGYGKVDQQTIIYDTQNVVIGSGQKFSLAESINFKKPDSIAVLTDTKIATTSPDAFAVTLDRTGRVIDGFAFGGIGLSIPTIPKGGVALYGVGKGADFLRWNGIPGHHLTFEAEPLFVPISEKPKSQYPLMMNPNDPRNQDYTRSIVKEVVSNYDVDGIIFDDRLRYGGMYADFSPVTEKLFEQRIGKKLKWPDDVFKYTLNLDLSKGIQPGRYYDQWMAWRASQLTEFLASVRATIKQTKPSVQLGIYAGSWYGEYPALGSNYASPEAETSFWFATQNYRKSGMAPLLDYLVSGCYYSVPTIYDAMSLGKSIGSTVEAAGTLTNQLARDEAWVYAGLSLIDFAGNPTGLEKSLQAACASTEGVMVFDLSHDIEPMWPVFKRAFSVSRKAPHQLTGLLESVRQKRRTLDKAGIKSLPIIISAGSAGTGQ